MPSQVKEIRITPDAVKKYAKTAIHEAILEAIYNGIDADASQIDVVAVNQHDSQMRLFDDDESLKEIQVIDTGYGIDPEKIESAFLDLEQSWKRDAVRQGKRPFHGARGCGRFKCLAVGAALKWETVFEDREGKKHFTTITLNEQEATKLHISETVDADDKPCGTILTISQLKGAFCKKIANAGEFKKLLFDVMNGLILDLELDGPRISFFGETIDTSNYKEADATFPFSFTDHENNLCDGEMRIIVWNSKVDFTDHKHSFLYKSDNSFLCEHPSGFPADYRWPAHTLIFKSTGFDRYDSFASEWHSLYARVEAATQNMVLQYLTEVKQKEFSGVLKQICGNEKYPFKKPPETPLEIARNATYNLVLGELVFNNSRELAPKKKAIGVVLPLLTRLFDGDYLLGESLDKIIGLSSDDSTKFHSFVTRIKLSKILSKYAELIRRKTFLETLTKLVYDESISAHLAERTQLHKIVAEEVWIFGEGYEEDNLLASDKGIVTLIRQNAKRKGLYFDDEGNEDLERIISELRSEDDTCINKIPDLALTKKIKDGGKERYLVIELKKPRVKINADCRKQALDVFAGISAAKKKGALQIDSEHQWQYCLVSSSMDERLKDEFTSSGHLEEKESGNYFIDVWLWSEIIDKANARINAAMDQLTIDIQEQDCQTLLDSYARKYGVLLADNH